MDGFDLVKPDRRSWRICPCRDHIFIPETRDYAAELGVALPQNYSEDDLMSLVARYARVPVVTS
jgi:hypothetical protein